MMGHDAESRYFYWLCAQVVAPGFDPASNHYMLAEQLHRKPFVSYVANDDNRARDGVALRYQFDENYVEFGAPCSVLEMLVALARRVAFEASDSNIGYATAEWFWRMLDNAGLRRYTDEVYLGDIFVSDEVEAILDNLVERRYRANGDGGLFPLTSPKRDQRKLELWYQALAYILERSDIGDFHDEL